jgi:hypothetical protein
MKKSIAFLGFVSMIIIYSCDYGILYEKPQPDNSIDLRTFPASLMGSFIDDSNKTLLQIDTLRIIKITRSEFAVSKAEIDTVADCKLEGDQLYVNDLNSYFPVKVINDSVFGKIEIPDTLFTLSKTNVLRKMKKDYFLSIGHKSGYWQVVRLRVHSDKLIEFSVIPLKVDYEILNHITPVRKIKDFNDSIEYYLISPSPYEFKTLLKKGLFNQTEIYHR